MAAYIVTSKGLRAAAMLALAALGSPDVAQARMQREARVQALARNPALINGPLRANPVSRRDRRKAARDARKARRA
jgi:hypothetical protein